MNSSDKTKIVKSIVSVVEGILQGKTEFPKGVKEIHIDGYADRMYGCFSSYLKKDKKGRIGMFTRITDGEGKNPEEKWGYDKGEIINIINIMPPNNLNILYKRLVNYNLITKKIKY